MAVRFHLPGLRYNYPLNMLMLNMTKTCPHYFREGVEIASFFGEFPTSRWNGGRFSGDDQCDAEFVRAVVATINRAGVPIRYTYTNPLINEADLQDAYCNFCMKAADNGMNEVLVFSPILETYIRRHYPGYKINSSTCKEIRSIEALNEELEKDYSLVVLDYNFNNRFEQLAQVRHREKCEILVNACCVPECPRRGAHYRAIAEMQRVALKNRSHPEGSKIPMPQWRCEYGENASLYTIREYPTFISADDIWEKYVPMGFENFKIEGRTANLFSLVDTYCYYLMKPEYRDEGRLLLMVNLENSKVIKVNRPRKGSFSGNEKV